MSAFVVATYKVTNPDGFREYAPKAQETLAAAGAEVVAVDLNSEVIEGNPHPVTVILKFESKDAMKAWYNSPEYQAVIGLRTDNSEGSMVLIDGSA
jgi:uncharacterized protein (DUF1330 family)